MKYINLLESFVEETLAHTSTQESVDHASSFIKTLDDQDFADLLSISGYIPDSYRHDSSEETIYSKFVELLVCEWAIRIGFKNSFLPTQKSSMEDISIQDETNVIVADAKSFRLSRSQGAPNVKDVIKEGDYIKWLSKYENLNKIGGIITFPEMFEWKKSSDVHSYLTNKNNKILLLYYSHLAAILTLGITSKDIIRYFKSFDENFPILISKDQNPKEKYFKILHDTLFQDYKAEIKAKMNDAKKVNKKIKENALLKINKIIVSKKENLEKNINAYDDFNSLKKFVIEKFLPTETEEVERLKANIKKFR